MDKNYTHMTLVVDRSGSMNSIRDEWQNSVNDLIKEQKNGPGKMTLSIVQFDSEYEILHNGVMIEDVPFYYLIPRGMTALHDAVGRAISSTGEFLAALDEESRPGKVLVVIVTDGGENASQEYKHFQIKEMVEHQTNKYNWDFTFIGANIDAFAVGSNLGFKGNIQYQSDSASVRSLYSSVSNSILNLRGNPDDESTLAATLDEEY